MSRTSAMLTGLSLATGIARDAADGVPIVKQVLGVASRIVGLAEQIDKNREDLHALADRAKRMDRTITAVVGDREPGAHLLCRLEDMNDVLRAVEKHFNKHVKQCAIRKTFGYIFTVRKEVDRLRGEFDDRLRELEVAATLDTNISAKGDAKFNGEFRNIRHCEIDLLRRITRRDETGEDHPTNCYLATCDGSNQLVVVREFAVSGHYQDVRRRIEVHDNILERISLVKNRHPNIAYLYGRNTGTEDNRFDVLKAGDIRPLADVLGQDKTADLSFMGPIVAKLMDASFHLYKHGANWSYFSGLTPNLYLDKNYDPRIGIDNDLYTIQATPGGHAHEIKGTMAGIIGIYCLSTCFQEVEFPGAHFKSTKWISELFGTFIEAGYRTSCAETVFRRDDVSSLIPLSPELRKFLLQSDSSWRLHWTTTPLNMAIGDRRHEGSSLHAIWSGTFERHASIIVDCFEDAFDTVYHSSMRIEIPSSAVTAVRQKLGISAGNNNNGQLKRFEGYSGTAMECTGWR